jgi:hypothetical protein
MVAPVAAIGRVIQRAIPPVNLAFRIEELVNRSRRRFAPEFRLARQCAGCAPKCKRFEAERRNPSMSRFASVRISS